MTYTVGKTYLLRTGSHVRCVAGWGSLPKFELNGNTIVQAPDGRYRFDGVDHPRDVIKEAE